MTDAQLIDAMRSARSSLAVKGLPFDIDDAWEIVAPELSAIRARLEKSENLFRAAQQALDRVHEAHIRLSASIIGLMNHAAAREGNVEGLVECLYAAQTAVIKYDAACGTGEG